MGHSATVWVGALLISVFLGLVYASVWLKGTAWFTTTMSTLGAAFGVLSLEPIGTESDTSRILSIIGMAIAFAFMFYVIGGRYITKTSIRDMTYQSHEDLVEYIEHNRLSSPLARVLRLLGPSLLVVIVAFACIAFCAKYAGLVLGFPRYSGHFR
jgi:hypothetical protein